MFSDTKSFFTPPAAPRSADFVPAGTAVTVDVPKLQTRGLNNSPLGCCLRCFAPPPCSNPPAAVPLICFYKTETPASGSDTGVLGGRGWIRTTEAEKQQIYSLSPLATREHAHILFTVRAGLPVYLTTAPGICQVFCRKLFCRNAGSLFPKEKHPNPQRIQVP